MYSQYPSRQACVDSMVDCRPPRQPLITYEVVGPQHDELMRIPSAARLQNASPMLEDSLDSCDSPRETLKTNSQRRPRRIRPRKAVARQLVFDEEEMLKLPSPDMLNSMMRGVELNGKL
ncbi:unnamed protein product [Strongylus vulgaris]|uniref:Uncharacterized protein n=1 Tax=Strongylus vulgaris TaxID=40348 RepID=A0A3P7JD41_STRVU|nr:unnamed protein product [Strongylus vulgaris]